MSNSAATNVVDARNITKRFREVSALRDVSMAARRGEVHGLLGPNGAGKTTLLRILLGLVRRDEGDIRLFDRELPRQPLRAADRVAAVLEGAGFYPYLTGRRNLMLAVRMDDIPVTDAAIANVLTRVGLASDADRRVAGYSAGMRQRLALAAALLRGPELLLLDEPTSAMDPAGARDVCALVAELAAGGTTVLLSSHDLIEVEQLCTSVTILRAGEVIFSGSVDRLRGIAEVDVHLCATSDDNAARAIAARTAGVRVLESISHETGLAVAGTRDAIDRFAIALGLAGVAVRELRRRERSLASVFLQLTGAGDRG
jgi:ABC-2 type transport system ATP-binding protein